ncbi:hypothetical protein [Arthrobacter dokdonensis]|uniref:hypothetical protein n=1 Tax=Arthrobacter dokdonellae TaxID=2211210 RepID=UPI000DE596EA|nr:hypothetical protein [Arthrobacter dokdonellae]
MSQPSHLQEATAVFTEALKKGRVAPDPELLEAIVRRFMFGAHVLDAKYDPDRAGDTVVMGDTHFPSSIVVAAVNMQRSVDALGPALSEVGHPVSPQLARSLQATEVAWKDMEAEFGLLSSIEVSKRVGSRSPNRSYASEQRAKGNLLAVKRPGGFRYPGYQIDPHERMIRPVMHELIETATAAGATEPDLALWLCVPTGYLDGDRPVDRLHEPAVVAEAARQSFSVQW